MADAVRRSIPTQFPGDRLAAFCAAIVPALAFVSAMRCFGEGLAPFGADPLVGRAVHGTLVLVALAQSTLAFRVSKATAPAYTSLFVGAMFVATFGSFGFVAMVQSIDGHFFEGDPFMAATRGTENALLSRVWGETAAGALLLGVAVALAVIARRDARVGRDHLARTTRRYAGTAFVLSLLMFVSGYCAVVQRTAMEGGNRPRLAHVAMDLASILPRLEATLRLRHLIEGLVITGALAWILRGMMMLRRGIMSAGSVWLACIAILPLVIWHGALAVATPALRRVATTRTAMSSLGRRGAPYDHVEDCWSCNGGGSFVHGELLFPNGSRLPPVVSRGARALEAAPVLPHPVWQLSIESQIVAQQGGDPFAELSHGHRWFNRLELCADHDATRRDLRVVLEAATALGAEQVLLVGERHRPELDVLVERFGDLELAFPLATPRKTVQYVYLPTPARTPEREATNGVITFERVDDPLFPPVGRNDRPPPEPTYLEFTDDGDLVSLVTELAEAWGVPAWLYVPRQRQ